MIRVENISWSVGSKQLLSDVSASFQGGKMNLIIGPNGAGKTTLIRLISRQLTPASGEITFDDKPARAYKLSELATFRAVLSQNMELAFPLSVSEVVAMGRYPHYTGRPGPKDIRAVEEAMRLFEVWPMRDRNYLTLSGGEKQRVHFARVMAQIWYREEGRSRYLLLDEPLTFLDVHYQFQFMQQLTELLRDPSLVVVGVVHDLNLAARFADHLVLLKDGKIMASGGPTAVLTTDNIKACFHLEPHVHHDPVTDRHYLFFR